MSRKIHMPKIDGVLERVGKAIGENKDSAIAAALEVSPQTLANWKSRGTVPWVELFSFAQKHDTSLDYLLTGESKNPGGFSPQLVDKYPFLQTITPRILRAARENRSAFTLAGVIQKLMEAERIDLTEDLTQRRASVRSVK